MKKQQQQQSSVYLKGRDAAHLLGIKPRTLKEWRSKGLLQRNVHYYKPSTKSVLYHRALLLDFIANIERPEEHERAIEQFLGRSDKFRGLVLG